MSNVSVYVLGNGVRLVVDEMPDVSSVSMVVGIGVGGRYEDNETCGISHFVEHMAFKGTESKNVREIAEFFDGLGAQYNAYTSKETTFFYFKVLAEYWREGAPLLLDMVFCSIYPQMEMERERGVILEEISESEDDPEDKASEMYMEKAFSSQQLGQPILGPRDNIKNMSRELVMNFVSNNYVGRNIVVTVAGNVKKDDIFDYLRSALEKIPSGERKIYARADYVGGDARVHRDLEQMQVFLGFPGVGLLDKDYYAYKVMGVILGDGMSSRLFQEAREKKGLAYSIHAGSSGYYGCGTMTVYASTSPTNLWELLKVSVDQMVDMIHNTGADELKRSKNRIRASVLLGREDSMSRALWATNSHLTYEQYLSADYVKEAVNSVTLDDIKRSMHGMLGSKKMTLSILGKIEGAPSYQDLRDYIDGVLQ